MHRRFALLASLCACNVSTLGPPLAESAGDSSTSTSDGETTGEPTTTTVTTLTTGGGDDELVPTACIDLEPHLVGLLEAHCNECHGAGSVAQGGIDYILDLDQLISQTKIVPGNPAESRIYVRMTADINPMPPLSQDVRPSLADISAVNAWISKCAADKACAVNEFIDRDQMLNTVAQDLGSLALDAQPFTRYLSLVHLQNAGLCDGDTQPQRDALVKLLNSLSQGLLVRKLEPIDEQRLLFRIDIRDYAWNTMVTLSEASEYFDDVGKSFPDVWEMIADQDPYAVEYTTDQGLAIAATTTTRHPILQADAFLDVAVRAPLYYDILGIPKRVGRLLVEQPECMPDECLETRLGLNLLAEGLVELTDDSDMVARAGIYKSDISDFNRILERHQFPNAANRAFWLTHDFSAQSGSQNIKEHPLDFVPDANLILYSLPNGLQAYMVTDADGQRLNLAPVNIVQDASQPDYLVRGAVSCIGCHAEGLHRAEDDIRHDLDDGVIGDNFPAQDKDWIRRLYPLRDEFADAQTIDIDRFRVALTQCGLTPDDAEPVLPAFLRFAEDVDLTRAAAELGLRTDELAAQLGTLTADLSDLASEGGTVQRQNFTAYYGASICRLGLGNTRCCPDGLLLPECGG